MYASGQDCFGLIALLNSEPRAVARYNKSNMLAWNVGKAFAMVFSNCSVDDGKMVCLNNM